jgi:excisionase family DNA binding protein
MYIQEEYMKVDEVARLLRVSIRTIYRRIQSGQLPARKIGGLYYIRKSDLDAQFVPVSLSSDALLTPPIGFSSSLKCSHCLRILRSPQEIGATCREPGCDAILCRLCVENNVQYCPKHSPSQETIWAEYERQYQTGEIQVFVKNVVARARELNFLQRIHLRLSRVSTLAHPLTGETLDIPNWDNISEHVDERRELMHLLGRVYLEKNIIENNPLNAGVVYHIPSGKSQKSTPLEIRAQCLSRLDSMVNRGCDTQPLTDAVLLPYINHTYSLAIKDTTFRMIILASTSGWNDSAKQIITRATAGQGYVHPRSLFYLYDLEKGELIFNIHDEKAVRYAALFNPLTEAEELYEVTELIKKHLLLYDSLTLEYAARILPFSTSLVEKAFKELETSGDYTLISVPDLGLAIIRKTT